MALRIVRVQDDSGRGPWRPGFSRHWVDREGPLQPPPCFEEFPGLSRRLRPGFAHGCGCRTLAQLARWFSADELRRLHEFGYRVVEIDVDMIIAESDSQIVFARRRPLRFGAVPVVVDLEKWSELIPCA